MKSPTNDKNQDKTFLKNLKYLYKCIDCTSSLLWSHENHLLGKRLRSEYDGDIETSWKNKETTQIGYGEISMGSMTKLFNLFQNISELINEHSDQFKESLLYSPEEYNMNADSLFLDIGSGFGKPVFHSAIQVNCISDGIEVVPARVEFCIDFLYENLKEKSFFDNIKIRKPVYDVANDKNGIESSPLNLMNDSNIIMKDETNFLETNKFLTEFRLDFLDYIHYENILRNKRNFELSINKDIIFDEDYFKLIESYQRKKVNKGILVDVSESLIFSKQIISLEMNENEKFVSEEINRTINYLLDLNDFNDETNYSNNTTDSNNSFEHLNFYKIIDKVENLTMLDLILFLNVFIFKESENNKIIENIQDNFQIIKSKYQTIKETSLIFSNKLRHIFKQYYNIHKSKKSKKKVKKTDSNFKNQINLENLSNTEKAFKIVTNKLTYDFQNNWVDKIDFFSADATQYENYSKNGNHYTHIYAYNKLMSGACRKRITAVLNNTNFKVLAWFSNHHQTLKSGLKNVVLLCKFPMQSTSTEKFHIYIYLKSK